MVEYIASDVSVTECFVEEFGMKVEVSDTFVAALAVFETGMFEGETFDADVFKLSQFFH